MHVTREEYDRFLAAVAGSVETIEDYICIEVDGKEIELTEFPAVQGDCEEWEENYLETDDLSDFPAILAEVRDTFMVRAIVAHTDRLTRRAEQGYCDC